MYKNGHIESVDGLEDWRKGCISKVDAVMVAQKCESDRTEACSTSPRNCQCSLTRETCSLLTVESPTAIR